MFTACPWFEALKVCGVTFSAETKEPRPDSEDFYLPPAAASDPTYTPLKKTKDLKQYDADVSASNSMRQKNHMKGSYFKTKL